MKSTTSTITGAIVGGPWYVFLLPAWWYSVSSPSALSVALAQVGVLDQKPCKVQRWLAQQDPKDSAQVLDSVTEFGPSSVLRATVDLHGISEMTWRRHFTSACSCYRTGVLA